MAGPRSYRYDFRPCGKARIIVTSQKTPSTNTTQQPNILLDTAYKRLALSCSEFFLAFQNAALKVSRGKKSLEKVQVCPSPPAVLAALSTVLAGTRPFFRPLFCLIRFHRDKRGARLYSVLVPRLGEIGRSLSLSLLLFFSAQSAPRIFRKSPVEKPARQRRKRRLAMKDPHPSSNLPPRHYRRQLIAAIAVISNYDAFSPTVDCL